MSGAGTCGAAGAAQVPGEDLRVFRAREEDVSVVRQARHGLAVATAHRHELRMRRKPHLHAARHPLERATPTRCACCGVAPGEMQSAGTLGRDVSGAQGMLDGTRCRGTIGDDCD